MHEWTPHRVVRAVLALAVMALGNTNSGTPLHAAPVWWIPNRNVRDGRHRGVHQLWLGGLYPFVETVSGVDTACVLRLILDQLNYPPLLTRYIGERWRFVVARHFA